MKREVLFPAVLILVCLLSCNLPSSDGGQEPVPESGTSQDPNPHMDESYVDEEPGSVLLPDAEAPVQEEQESVPAGSTPSPEESEQEAPGSEYPCILTTAVVQTVYSRPSLEAQVFGTLGAGMDVSVAARTGDGWWGFDPGVAQAANVGVFRYRWIQEGPDVTLEGGCSVLPLVEGPPPGVCFTMPMGDVPVYADSDAGSTLLATMAVGDYAAVSGRRADGWARLDLEVGTLELSGPGWIEPGYLNMNGPCENLPEIAP